MVVRKNPFFFSLENELENGLSRITYTDLSFLHRVLYQSATLSSLDKWFPSAKFSTVFSFQIQQNTFIFTPVLYNRSERYLCFKNMNKRKPRMKKISFFGVAWQIANKLSEMRLDLRDHP